MILQDLFEKKIEIVGNYFLIEDSSNLKNQQQTNEIFSDKWDKVDKEEGLVKMEEFQKNWYLKLYGFKDEIELQSFLKPKKVILDAGCGLGYKAAWFALLAPESIVIGMDYSDSAIIAARNYKEISNLYFVKGDIAKTKIKHNTIDYVSCDQVIHHTEKPDETFAHLTDITKKDGEFACYVYAKKALPRELLDSHFREYCKEVSRTDLWQMSESLTELGKTLSELNIDIDVPDIPLLGIKGGKYDIQRFIYWNFIKCFWNDELGYKNSIATNFDWYAPSNAKRYSEKEYQDLIYANALEISFFHSEEACYSGRFRKLNLCVES